MKAAFAGSFAVRLAEPVRTRLKVPCEIVTGDEAGVLTLLSDADVLVSMGFNGAMAAASPRLRLVQVPGAGLDRIDRSQFRPGLALANAFGHEAGIAEYIIGTMISLTRSFRRIDQKLRAGEWAPVVGWDARTSAVARACRKDAWHSRLRPHRRGACTSCPRLRHAGVCSTQTSATQCP
jgi:hypothetical protein